MRPEPNGRLSADFTAENKLAQDRPRVRVLHYPGSKAGWIADAIQYIPADHGTFVLPFAGSAPTLFAKRRSDLEVINDLNDAIFAFFRALRDHRQALIRRIWATSYSRAEFELCLQRPDPYDLVEHARRVYFWLWMSRYPFDNRPTWRRQYRIRRKGDPDSKGTSRPISRRITDVEHLYAYAARLRGVQIECMDAFELIRRYDHERALFWCDPPYLPGTRRRKSHYAHEMTVEQHRALAKLLNGIEGMAAVFGYASPEYQAWYEARGWHRIDFEGIRTDNAHRGGEAVESLWLNPLMWTRYQAELAARPRMRSLFDERQT